MLDLAAAETAVHLLVWGLAQTLARALATVGVCCARSRQTSVSMPVLSYGLVFALQSVGMLAIGLLNRGCGARNSRRMLNKRSHQ